MPFHLDLFAVFSLSSVRMGIYFVDSWRTTQKIVAMVTTTAVAAATAVDE